MTKGKRRWWPVLAPVGALAIGASLLFPAGRHQWALSLFRQPARYTALSFSHPAELPSAVRPGQPITVSFMVSNHEGHLVDYRYFLRTSGDGRSRILGTSSKAVAAGATWAVSTVVRPTCGTSPCRVDVSLPGHPETIDFLVTILARGTRRA